MVKKANDETVCTLRLLALAAVRGLPQKEQIRLMGLAGFDRHRIAEAVGTTPLTVSVTLTKLKKESPSSSKGSKK